MNTHAERALGLVLSVYDGDPWHGPSITSTLAGVTAAQAAERPVPGAHSIWELVLHVTAWTHEVASRLTGAPAHDPQEGDWPATPEPTDENWQAALRGLANAQRALETTVRDVPDQRWDAKVGDTRVPPITTATHLETLEGLVAHHAYHAGQIALLKRARR